MTPSPASRPVLRLRDPGAVVDAVPVLTGFHPAESLVLLALRPPRGRLGLTLRADLAPAADDSAFVPRTVAALRRDGATAALVVVFSEEGAHPSVLPWRSFVTDLVRGLRDGGLEVREQLCVRRRRWFSYTCVRSCCPVEGTPLPEGTSPVAAQAVLEGRVVLPDRAALAATLAGPPPGSAAARLRQRELAALASRGPSPAGAAVTGFRALVAARTARRPVPVRQLLHLLVALDRPPARDALLVTVTDDDLPGAVDAATLLLRAAVPPWTVVPATVLAWCAWRRGDGALANLAVDVALAADPQCALASGVATALRHGVRAVPQCGVGMVPPRGREVG